MCLKSVLFLLVIRLKNASYVNVYIHPEYYSSLKNYRFSCYKWYQFIVTDFAEFFYILLVYLYCIYTVIQD